MIMLFPVLHFSKINEGLQMCIFARPKEKAMARRTSDDYYKESLSNN